MGHNVRDYRDVDFSDFRASLERRVLQTADENRSDPSTAAARAVLCGGCEHAVTMFPGGSLVEDVKMCDFCGCITELKARLANSTCPLKRW